jgi:hypothetical protein
MAPRKAGDRKAASKNLGDAGGVENIPKVLADHNSIAISGIDIGRVGSHVQENRGKAKEETKNSGQ